MHAIMSFWALHEFIGHKLNVCFGNIMKPLSRDITCALILKSALLFLLWYVCIKSNYPHSKAPVNWLVPGASVSVNNAPSIGDDS